MSNQLKYIQYENILQAVIQCIKLLQIYYRQYFKSFSLVRSCGAE